MVSGQPLKGVELLDEETLVTNSRGINYCIGIKSVDGKLLGVSGINAYFSKHRNQIS